MVAAKPDPKAPGMKPLTKGSGHRIKESDEEDLIILNDDGDFFPAADPQLGVSRTRRL